jgi:hypothetical protein
MFALDRSTLRVTLAIAVEVQTNAENNIGVYSTIGNARAYLVLTCLINIAGVVTVEQRTPFGSVKCHAYFRIVSET